MLHERFGDAGIDVVVAHLVAHPEGAPAEREFGEVAGSQHDPPVRVRQAEQEVGAQAGLDVLEGHVVGLLAPGEGVVDVFEDLPGRGLDVDLSEGHAEPLAELLGVFLRALGGGEAGHRVGEHVGARAPQPIHGLGGDDERVGGVEPARDADDDFRVADRLEPLCDCVHLDVVGLIAVLVELGLVVGDEGEAVQRTAQAHGPSRVGIEREGDGAEDVGASPDRCGGRTGG